MISLSVVIITLNEEKNILRCLESVKNIADEIVVVDSLSTDRTEEICRGYGVKFIKNPFPGHIEQKNFAITQASSKYILSVDADEALSPELEKSISEVKNNWKYDGCYFNRLNNYCGKWIKHGGWYPDRKMRLWDSTKGTWKGNNPHDRYELAEGATSYFLKGDLLHYSYHSVYQHIEQINKFTEIGAKADFNRGRKVSFPVLILIPLWKFIRDYFFKLGILDGYYGLIICKLSSYAAFIKYVKIRELWRNNKV